MAVDKLTVLCLNAGSSSLKYALFRGEKALAEGEFADVKELFAQLPAEPDAVGHRLVFGGDHTAPVLLDAGRIQHLQTMVPFAPLHLPAELELVSAVKKQRPKLPQVACFDTAFHCAMPELAQRFPLSEEFWEQGVRRYGFHGLSYEYICTKVKASRVVIAHLGNGASLAAVKDGQPVDTTMGLTPTGGLMMGTRSGDLDPGLLLYLQRQGEDLEATVDRRAGLLGVSGISSDMQVLLASDDPRAQRAVQLYCYILRKQIGAMVAALGGVDQLIFTGGIGEHAAAVRQLVCQGLNYLGLKLDVAANAHHEETISDESSRLKVRVIPTNEDLMIARHVAEVLK